MTSHEFLSELAEMFPGSCEWSDDNLLINFQHDSLNNLNFVPILVGFDEVAMRCWMFAFCLADIEENQVFQALSICNTLNRNVNISASFYLNKENEIDACYDFLFLPDMFVVYAVGPISKMAKDVDISYGVLTQALNQS